MKKAWAIGLWAWRSRWNVLRLAIAVFLLWTFTVDHSARLARMALSQMPGFDYAAEVRALRLEGRFGEAAMLAESGLTDANGPAREALLTEQQAVKDEQASFIRIAKDAGLGAISGQGKTLEGLVGAVAADFFIVGDVRDLVVQGGKFVIDGDSDEVILALSVVGVVTTIAPAIDWVPSIMKVARRGGAISKQFGEFLVSAVKRQDVAALRPVLDDVGAIARKGSPGFATRVLKHADTPEDLASLARFVERQSDGAAAIHIAGKEGADLVKLAARGTPAAAATAEKTLLKAARKGPAGVRFITSGPGKAMLKPHPLLGLLKAVYKGNATDLATRLADRLDPNAWWLVPLCGAWAFGEGTLLVRRVTRLGRGVPASPPGV